MAEAQALVASYAELEALVARHLAALGHLRARKGELEGGFAALVAQQEAPPQPRLQQLRRRLWELQHPGEALPEEKDEELVLVGGAARDELLCPLTKLPLEQPVRNAACRHLYSRPALLLYVKGGAKTCPVAGCGAKVSQRSVEAAPDVEERVRLALRDGKSLSLHTQPLDEGDVMQL